MGSEKTMRNDSDEQERQIILLCDVCQSLVSIFKVERAMDLGNMLMPTLAQGVLHFVRVYTLIE